MPLKDLKCTRISMWLTTYLIAWLYEKTRILSNQQVPVPFVLCAWHTSNAISNSAVNNLTLCLYSLPHGYYWKSTRKLKTNTKECGYINRNFHKSVKAVWWFISIVDCYYKFIFNRLTSYQARLHTMVEYNESAQPNNITRTDSKGTCWKMNCRRKL